MLVQRVADVLACYASFLNPYLHAAPQRVVNNPKLRQFFALPLRLRSQKALALFCSRHFAPFGSIPHILTAIEFNGLLNRVGKCRECGLYFVDFPKGRGKPRVQYCCADHANRDRSRRYRIAKRAKKTPA